MPIYNQVEALSRIIDEHLIAPAYQPLVDLYSGETLGYEALARGPEGALQRPDQLFGAAREQDLLYDLDRECRAAAVRGAMEANLVEPATLFVNVEPAAIDMSGPSADKELRGLTTGVRLMVEITERALTSRPADLLPLVERLRAYGVGVALDDIGADRRSLALMPFLRPDVIKLDLRLTQEDASEEVAEVHNAVSAHAERTGALVVAEGIETAEHAERARAMGATVGQGWFFGRPGPIPQGDHAPAAAIPIFESPVEDAHTPFQSMHGHRPLRRGTKRLLLAISRELERQASSLGANAVLLSTFQHARYFGPRPAAHYSAMARSLAFVGALGEDIGTNPAPGVRGGELLDGDPLCEEWDVVVVAPHFAAAFTALDLGDTDRPDLERRFDFQLTHDRDLAVRAARSLMARIDPVGALVAVPSAAAA